MHDYRTLKQIRDQVAGQIGDTSSGRATKIDEWANSHYFEICKKHPWPQLLRSSEQDISLTAGATHVYLPKEVETLFFVMPANVDAAVNMAIESILRNASTQFQASGTVFAYADAGEFGRRRDFHTVAEKMVLTTSGSAAVAAVIHGTVTGESPNITSQEIRETGSISPSTGYTSTNTFTDLHGISIETLTAASIITVTGQTSGNIYATIGEGEQTARYRRIRLMQPDAGGSAVTLVWKKRPFHLISDNQAIEVPIGQQIVDATVATMLVNQREYNAAAIYHQGRASEGVKDAFAASMQQGDHIYLGQPIGQRKGRRIVVVNP